MPEESSAQRTAARALGELLAEVDARAAALAARLGQEQSAADEASAVSQECDRGVADLEGRLSEWRDMERLASEDLQAVKDRVAAVLKNAAGEVRSISKRQLEEVRALAHPPAVVRRTLGLVFCTLHPREAEQFVKAAKDIPWKEKVVPMLKREDFVRRLEAFPPTEQEHPLLVSQAIAEFLEAQIVDCSAEPPPSDSARYDDSGGGGASKDAAVLEAPPRLSAEQSGERQSAGDAGHGSASNESGNAAGPARNAAAVLRRNTVHGADRGGAGRSGPADARQPAEARRQRRSQTTASATSEHAVEDGRLSVDAVKFASHAVGALFRWLLAQLRYVRALRDDGAHDLEREAASLRARSEDVGQHGEGVARSLQEARDKATAAGEALTQARGRITEVEEELANTRREAEALRRQMAAAAAAQAAAEEAEEVDEAPAPEEVLESALLERRVALSSVEVEVRERVVFGRGSTDVTSFATRALHGVANVMQESGDIKLMVEGFSRSDEADDLSTQRANKVLEALVAQGVPRHRLRAAGFGSEGEGDGRVQFSVIQEITVKGTVQFGPCSDRVTGDSGPVLDSVAALLCARPCMHVRVEGHTDNAPWFGDNLELSEARAGSVIRALHERGLDRDRFVAVGFGDKLPRTSNGTREGKAQNRRVEFHVLQRETIGDLRALLRRSQSRGQIDENVRRHLAHTASGAGVKLALPIRIAAADLLRRVCGDWSVQRLLYIAARHGDSTRCPMALLPEDCVHRVLRMYFLLGCSDLSR